MCETDGVLVIMPRRPVIVTTQPATI